MKWFVKKKPAARAPQVQLRDVEHHPFGMLDRYVPLRRGELDLYRSIREAVPIVDAALLKLVRLCGGVIVRCPDPEGQRGLEQFLAQVDTGRGQRGIQSFLDQYLDSMFTCGQGVGEIVLSPGGQDIAALLCADPGQVEIKEGDTPLDFRLCTRDGSGQLEELPWQELLLFTPFQPGTDSPYGVSLLRSMPFLSGILLKIYQAVGQNWERVGNLRFAVVCKPGEGDGLSAQERGEMVASEWSAAMRSTRQGAVRDFVAVGDVDIKVIGADNQILDSEVPVRQILEQLIARTGIPPFLLGLSWSSTERMSVQQADLLTSEITAIRRGVEPVVRRVCQLWLRLHGIAGPVEVDWEDINLQDLVEEAKAGLYQAIRESTAQLHHIREVEDMVGALGQSEHISEARVTALDLGTGVAAATLGLPRELFYQTLSEQSGFSVSDDGDLMSLLTRLSAVKAEYDKVAGALKDVRETGYGIVVPGIDELTLEEPEIMKQGGRYGVRLKASAPSIHMIRADIETAVSPIVGNEKQSEDMVNYLLQEFEGDTSKIWQSNIFGRSFHELVSEDLQTKLKRMPEDARKKLRETLERIINEGSGGLICIIL